VKITHVLPALTKGGCERVAADLASQARMNSRSGWEIVLVLMVMGNIPIIYQKESVDASKKCGQIEKLSAKRIWPELSSILGLAVGVRS